MYRVITTYRNRGSTRPIVEHGPWHPSRQEAERWAELLADLGYRVEIESQHGRPESADSNDSDLAAALSSMA